MINLASKIFTKINQSNIELNLQPLIINKLDSFIKNKVFGSPMVQCFLEGTIDNIFKNTASEI